MNISNRSAMLHRSSVDHNPALCRQLLDMHHIACNVAYICITVFVKMHVAYIRAKTLASLDVVWIVCVWDQLYGVLHAIAAWPLTALSAVFGEYENNNFYYSCDSFHCHWYHAVHSWCAKLRLHVFPVRHSFSVSCVCIFMFFLFESVCLMVTCSLYVYLLFWSVNTSVIFNLLGLKSLSL